MNSSEVPEKERVSAFANLSRVMVLTMVRDRMALFFILLMPLMFLVMFGFLFKGATSPHVKVAQFGTVKVLDDVQGDARTAMEKVITLTKVSDEAAGLEQVRKGKLDALIEDGPGGQPVLHFSATDQVKAGSVQGIVNSFVQTANQHATGQDPAYRLTTAQVEDNSLKPIQFITPGLLGWAIATGAIFGASLSLVSWRKKRVLRRLRLAPVSAGAVVSSRVVVSLLVALTQTAIFLLVATTPMFGLKLTGNWWLIVPLVLCSTIAFMSIGLVTGAFAKTEEAANGINQLIILPMSFLGGAFFPLDNAPGWLQGVSKIFPLHYLVTSATSVLSRGGGVADALPAMGGLLAFAAVMTALAWRFFSWDDA